MTALDTVRTTAATVLNHRYLPRAGLVAVAAVALSMPELVDDYTLISVNRMVALGLLAVSVAIMTGFAGLPSLGQAAPFAVGAYTAAVLADNEYVGLVQITAAAALAAVFSVLVGLAVVRTRGTTCLMVTLAIGQLTVVAVEQWKDVTGGSDGFPWIPATPVLWGGEPLIEDRQLYFYIAGVAAVVLTLTALVLRSPAGMLLAGVRDNEDRMRASGHPVTRYLLLAYVGAGVVAGIGGALLVAGQRFVSPGEVGFEISALALLAVIIGGSSSLLGSLLAMAFVLWVRDWLSPDVATWFRDNVSSTLQIDSQLLLGLVFIAAVYLLPRGLAGIRLPDFLVNKPNR